MDEKATKNIIASLENDGLIEKPKHGTKDFFMDKAINSLAVSKRLMQISEDKSENLLCNMWIINTSYYSMFFAATSLLAHFGKRIKTEIGIHRLTYHALFYYCHLNDKKLQKHFINEYKNQYEEAAELLEISEKKAIAMIENLEFEITKRRTFTYEIGTVAEKNKAMTSLSRAESFLTEVRKIII